MITDPEFSDIGKNKPKPRTVWRWAARLLVYPLLGLSGCHMLTGSPIPLWYTERLDHSVVVNKVTDKTLILADGRSIPLPFIKLLPGNDPVFLRALKHGVEVGQDGELVGLLTVYPDCGNDPCHWYTKRINMSDLAGFMDPDGIDDSIVPRAEIKSLKENESRSLGPHGLPYMVLNKAYKVRQIYKAARSRVEQEPNPIRQGSMVTQSLGAHGPLPLFWSSSGNSSTNRSRISTYVLSGLSMAPVKSSRSDVQTSFPLYCTYRLEIDKRRVR
jgi:hypothetical protein